MRTKADYLYDKRMLRKAFDKQVDALRDEVDKAREHAVTMRKRAIAAREAAEMAENQAEIEELKLNGDIRALQKQLRQKVEMLRVDYCDELSVDELDELDRGDEVEQMINTLQLQLDSLSMKLHDTCTQYSKMVKTVELIFGQQNYLAETLRWLEDMCKKTHRYVGQYMKNKKIKDELEDTEI